MRRWIVVLPLLLTACAPEPDVQRMSGTVREITVHASGPCRAADLGDGWLATAFHCYMAVRTWIYVADAGDLVMVRTPEAGPPPLRRLRCELRPPERAVWRGRVWPVRNGRLREAPARRGDSGSPVLDEEGRLWGVVSRPNPENGTVVAPVWPLCRRLEKRR